MKPTVALIALALAGCTNVPSAEEQARFREEAAQTAITSARAECLAFGISDGMPEFAACIERRADAQYQRRAQAYAAQNRAIEDQENWQRAAAAGIMTSYRPAPAVSSGYSPALTIRCRTVGSITTCN